MEKVEALVTDKREKSVSITSIDLSEFDGKTLDEVIQMFESLKSDEYLGYSVESSSDFSYDDGYAEVSVYGIRMETDLEVNIRVDNHNKMELQKFLREQEKEKKDKELYEQLKQKYES